MGRAVVTRAVVAEFDAAVVVMSWYWAVNGEGSIAVCTWNVMW